MSTLKRLQKLASVSRALHKSASLAGDVGKVGLAVAAPIAAGGLIVEAPGVMKKTHRKTMAGFQPAVHKAKLGLE